jgi:hypothetical protein
MVISSGRFKLEFDKDYGCNKRTGWSIVEHGSIIVELEPSIILCFVKWILRRRRFREKK